MTDTWTPEREAAAEARGEAATKGPWDGHVLHADGTIIKKSYYEISTPEYDVATWLERAAPIRKEADADFIAHARTDLPAAIRNGERLRQELIRHWPHASLTCPCSDRLPKSAPLDECTCGLNEALWGQEGEAT